jgi:hypothetical protein
MSKVLITLFLCVVLPLGLMAQQASVSKSDTKAAQKSEAWTPSSAAKTQYMRETGYRNGRPGYVVAYRKPLACGGTNDTSNLQWLTVAEAKAKAKSGKRCK